MSGTRPKVHRPLPARIAETAERVAWWCLLLLVGAVPLFVGALKTSAGPLLLLTDEPVSLPKAVLVAVLAFVGVASVLVSAALGGRGLRTHAVLWPAAGFGVLVVVSTVTSVSVSTSVFGQYARNEGLVAYAAYLAAGYLALSCVTDVRRLRTVLMVAAGTGIAVSIYAWMQYLAIDPLSWGAMDFGARVFATFGNPDNLASYLVFPFSAAAGLALSAAEERRAYAWWGATALVASALALTLVRGGWIGAGVSAIVLGVGAWRLGVRPNRREIVAIALVAVVALGALGLSEVRPQAGGSSFTQLTGPTGGSALSRSVGSRLDVWRVGMRALAAHPLTGTGPDTLMRVFPRYADKAYVEKWGAGYADNAHDLPVQVAVTLGVPALLLFVAVWVVVLASAAPAAFARDAGRSRALLLAPWAALAGLLGASLSGVSQPMVVVWLWVAAGLLVASRSAEHPVRSAWGRTAAYALAVVLVGCSAYVLTWLYADHLMARSTYATTPAQTLALSIGARQANALPQQYWIQVGRDRGMVLSVAAESGAPRDKLDELLAAQASAYRDATRHDPADAEAAIEYAYTTGREARAVVTSQTAAVALEAARRAVDVAPNDADARTALSIAQLAVGDGAAAVQSARIATELGPRYPDAWAQLGAAADATSDTQLAIDAFKSALALDPANSAARAGLQRLGSAP